MEKKKITMIIIFLLKYNKIQLLLLIDGLFYLLHICLKMTVLRPYGVRNRTQMLLIKLLEMSEQVE